MPNSVNQPDDKLIIDSKNFGLSENQFSLMIDGLKDGDETIFETVFLSHFEKCMNYLILRHQAGREDAYDATMWVMIQFRKRLIDGKISYGNMAFYFTKMAVNKYFSIVKKAKVFKMPFETDLIDIADENDTVEHELLFKNLEFAWDQMCDNCKLLLKKFYYDKIQLKEISKALQDTSEANTRKKKERCIKKLRNFFFTRLKEIE